MRIPVTESVPYIRVKIVNKDVKIKTVENFFDNCELSIFNILGWKISLGKNK